MFNPQDLGIETSGRSRQRALVNQIANPKPEHASLVTPDTTRPAEAADIDHRYSEVQSASKAQWSHLSSQS